MRSGKFFLTIGSLLGSLKNEGISDHWSFARRPINESPATILNKFREEGRVVKTSTSVLLSAAVFEGRNRIIKEAGEKKMAIRGDVSAKDRKDALAVSWKLMSDDREHAYHVMIHSDRQNGIR